MDPQYTGQFWPSTPAGTVRMPIEATYHARRSRRRHSTIPDEEGFSTPYNDRATFAYLGNVTLGEPAQVVSLELDWKGLDMWCQSSANPGCHKTDLDFCAISRTYNRGKSRTTRFTNFKGRMTYDDSTYARVSAVVDKAAISGKVMEQFTFGVSVESTAIYGRLGLGKSDSVGVVRADTLQNKLLSSGQF
ncbi:aspartic peptidase domain-containing protein, partial [Lipomyces arxii]|uniref:aspartic peptidase domain-containing protein n=1 Tax=Lipomyces arxii TaxID=56418 RepID=UPI0034CEEF19